MKTLALFLLLIVPGTAAAQNPSPVAAREITQLFSALQSSKCEFFRNNTWYNADKATEHLHRKYDYLLKKGLVTTAESFIDLAATKSSMSDKPYLVRCGKMQPVPSKSWFTGKLKELRARPVDANNSFKPTPLRGVA
jgi:hypothetical protein